MKKTIFLLLATLLAFSLCACGDNSLVISVQEKINAIEEVTLDSGSRIENAEIAYEALDDSDKAKIENYAELQFARSTYDLLLEEEVLRLEEEARSQAEEALRLEEEALRLEEEARLQAEEDALRLEEEARLQPIQEFAGVVLAKNAVMFKNPLSIKVKNAWYYYGGDLNKHYFTFEFEIENGVGNTQTVYYGNDGVFGYRELSESVIDSEVQLYVGLGVSTSFEENGIVAMQNGELLDAEYIQEYFLLNYGK